MAFGHLARRGVLSLSRKEKIYRVVDYAAGGSCPQVLKRVAAYVATAIVVAAQNDYILILPHNILGIEKDRAAAFTTEYKCTGSLVLTEQLTPPRKRELALKLSAECRTS